MSHQHAAVGGPLATRSFKWLVALIAVGCAAIAWRMLDGLGPTTAMNDGYPWGIWIAYDVVVGTALACGGYAVAILVYIFNKGQYHPLIRSAILTSALGYTMAGLSIVVDVGRYWNLYRVIIFPHQWNLNSVLLEVALCVMAYMAVLWLELSPAFLEQWSTSHREKLRHFAEKLTPIVNKALIWLVALGLLLPTMHQSSLGSVMMLAMHKLDPLWHTPWLPLLFLLSCIAMGYAAAVLESTISSSAFKLPFETPILAKLARVMVGLIVVYLALRWVDLGMRDQFGRVFTSGWLSFFFVLENLLFLLPVLTLLSPQLWRRKGLLFFSAILMLLAGGLYRFNTYLIAFNPGDGWAYFPSVPEMFITFGIVGIEIAIFAVLVKRFPILAGQLPHQK